MYDEKLETYRKDHLDEMTIAEMQQEMTDGNLTSEKLVLMYKETISVRNQEINAVLEINPEALLIAQALDFERQQTGPRSLLHGIPILLKDNIDTGDKMHTSAGSLALETHYALRDAKIVENLRRAGAVILGKANMTEWANFMSEKMTNGYSSRGGQVKNPYGDFDVGGSSSGSASAIASNLAAAAIGTETSGSIINPAAQNSLVGIKLTVGMTSRTGIIPIAHTQDVPGPMARTVADAVALLEGIVGVDPKDAITTLAEPFDKYDWSKHLKKDGLQGVKLGVARGLFNEITAEQAELFEKALTTLRQCGVEIIDEIDLGVHQEDVGFAVLLHEFKSDLNAYLAKSNPNQPIRSLADVIAFNRAHQDQALKYGQNLLEQANEISGTLMDREYVKALERNRFLAGEQGMKKTLETIGVDALVMPHYFGCNIGAAAGFPSITVPFGYGQTGEPFGVTFAGQAFSEPDLIEYAYAFEQQAKGRRKP